MSSAVTVMSLPAETVAPRMAASVVSSTIVKPIVPDMPNSELPSLADEQRLTMKLSFSAETVTSWAALTMAPSSMIARAVPWYHVIIPVPPMALLLNPTFVSLAFASSFCFRYPFTSETPDSD